MHISEQERCWFHRSSLCAFIPLHNYLPLLSFSIYIVIITYDITLFLFSFSFYLSVSPFIPPSFLKLFGVFPALEKNKIMIPVPGGKFVLIKCHSHTLAFKCTHKHMSMYTHLHTHTHIQKACICPNKTSRRQQNEL